MGGNRQPFKKPPISQGYTYKYILKLRKVQENMLYNMYTPTNLLEFAAFLKSKQSDPVSFMATRW